MPNCEAVPPTQQYDAKPSVVTQLTSSSGTCQSPVGCSAIHWPTYARQRIGMIGLALPPSQQLCRSSSSGGAGAGEGGAPTPSPAHSPMTLPSSMTLRCIVVSSAGVSARCQTASSSIEPLQSGPRCDRAAAPSVKPNSPSLLLGSTAA